MKKSTLITQALVCALLAGALAPASAFGFGNETVDAIGAAGSGTGAIIAFGKRAGHLATAEDALRAGRTYSFMDPYGRPTVLTPENFRTVQDFSRDAQIVRLTYTETVEQARSRMTETRDQIRREKAKLPGLTPEAAAEVGGRIERLEASLETPIRGPIQVEFDLAKGDRRYLEFLGKLETSSTTIYNVQKLNAQQAELYRSARRSGRLFGMLGIAGSAGFAVEAGDLVYRVGSSIIGGLGQRQ